MSTGSSITSAKNCPGHVFVHGVLCIAIAGAAAFVFELTPDLVLRLVLPPALARSLLVLSPALARFLLVLTNAVSPLTAAVSAAGLAAGMSAAGLAAVILRYSPGSDLPLTGTTVLLVPAEGRAHRAQEQQQPR